MPVRAKDSAGQEHLRRTETGGIQRRRLPWIFCWQRNQLGDAGAGSFLGI